MKILAYCLVPHGRFGVDNVQEWLPAIPAGLISTEGFLWKDGVRLVDDEFKTQAVPDIEVPEGCWLGIEKDGSCTVLHPDEEPKWRASRAASALEESQRLTKSTVPSSWPQVASNPLRAVCALHAAAALVGLRVAGLHDALQRARKSPSEPLEVTVRAMMESMARERTQHE